MLKFNITHQESYSRGELLLRTFLGIIYIVIPHIIALWFYSIWVVIATFLAWWIILFTGKTPEFYYTAMLGYNKWSLRLLARMYNLSDGYPSFGPNGTDDKTSLHFDLVHIGRGQLLLRSIFGMFYILIPHGICLYVRMIGTMFLVFFAWFAVLFTGKYPENWHKFNVGTFRWATRLNLYYGWLSEKYPPFNGAPDELDEADQPIDQVA